MTVSFQILSNLLFINHPSIQRYIAMILASSQKSPLLLNTVKSESCLSEFLRRFIVWMPTFKQNEWYGIVFTRTTTTTSTTIGSSSNTSSSNQFLSTLFSIIFATCIYYVISDLRLTALYVKFVITFRYASNLPFSWWMRRNEDTTRHIGVAIDVRIGIRPCKWWLQWSQKRWYNFNTLRGKPRKDEITL
jgi:hypothetical protein